MSPRNNPSRSSTIGVFVVDKPVVRSSMGAVAQVRRRAGGVKTGHAGTLDPLASGVLVLALGRATKIISRLMDTDKRYETEIDLSATTPSHDLERDPEPVAIERIPDEQTIRAALERFTGTIRQRPPAFSAMNIGGQRAYHFARRGDEPDLPEREVEVYALDVLSYDWPEVTLSIHCGKGFYVRSLARDLGRALGTGGYCTSIRRTAVGPFDLNMAIPLDEVPEPLTQEHLIPVDQALRMVEQSAIDRTPH